MLEISSMRFLFNPIVHSLLILTVLFVAPAQASKCSHVVRSDRGNPTAMHYTPSEPFKAGVSLADEVITQLENYSRDRKKRGSVWTRFIEHPHYRQLVPPLWKSVGKFAAEIFNRPYKTYTHPLFDIIEGINAALDGDSVGIVTAVSNDHLPDTVTNLIHQAKASGASFFLTWQELGLTALNRLFSHRAYPIGLVNQKTNIDGSSYNPQQVPLHDIFHVYRNEKTIKLFTQQDGKLLENFAEIFYRQIDYDLLAPNFSESDQILFDFGYFVYFHESDVNAN